MRNQSSNGERTYYNEFVDIKEIVPLKVRHKAKNNNLDNIKIAMKKLPPDFFRPLTRETPSQTKYEIERESFNKTPCFGDEKKQSYSLSLIPKQKRNLDYDHQRILTLPVQEADPGYRVQPRKNCTRQLPRKDNQFSHRNSHNRQLAREDQHQSTERQKIKYKKMTLNDQIYLEEKKMLNLEYQNRIRLNIKKFFQEDNQFMQNQAPNKSSRKPVQIQKMVPVQPLTKMKVKKLPPLL